MAVIWHVDTVTLEISKWDTEDLKELDEGEIDADNLFEEREAAIIYAWVLREEIEEENRNKIEREI